MGGLRVRGFFALALVAMMAAGACWAGQRSQSGSAPEGSIAWAKTISDGVTLPASLVDKVVSRVFADLGYFYVQEPGRTGGIRIYDPWSVYSIGPGAIVTIDGDMTTDDGERVVNAMFTTYPEQYTTAKPLFFAGLNLGGGRLNTATPGAAGARGLNNVGLLARIAGQVTYIDEGFVYVDDGSNCSDGTLNGPDRIPGVRVVGSLSFTPKIGDVIAVTGVSGLATYPSGYGRTIRLADPRDAIEVCPPPPPGGLSATPSDGTTVLLYWNEVPGAIGYNIYRGTSSGGENYSAPINGSTLVTARSFPGSDRFTYTDSGRTTNTPYFYTVRAVSERGETRPSNEDSAVASASAIPWATRNPALIVPAALLRSSLTITCAVDVIGPDGTIYTSEGDAVLPPVLGSYGPVPVDGSRSVQPPTPGMDSDNANGGPYRKVESQKNFWREIGTAVLPASNHIGLMPKAYPAGSQTVVGGRTVPCASSGDVPFVYLGSEGAGGEDVYAGLRYEPSDSKWNMFLRIGHSRLFWIFDPNPPAGHAASEYPTPANNSHWVDFGSGATALDYWCGKDADSQGNAYKNSVWLRASGAGGDRACFVEVSGHPKGGTGVSMKRVSLLAQSLPVSGPSSAEYEAGYAKTGSYILGAEWTGIQIYDMTRSWYVDSTYARYKQEFPIADENVVSFHMEAPYYWENNINLDLR